IDFIRLMPGVPKAKVKSRIIMTPDHAKRLLAALKDNIEKYEDAFGKINNGVDAPHFPLNFGGTLGEALKKASLFSFGKRIKFSNNNKKKMKSRIVFVIFF